MLDLKRIINSLFKKKIQHQFSNLVHERTYFYTLIIFIIYNNYIFQENLIYLQEVGILQGGCASSLLANLYLYSN